LEQRARGDQPMHSHILFVFDALLIHELRPHGSVTPRPCHA
jgi:hypothetical protein